MSPAPETVRNNSTSSSLSISTILSRAPRAPHESPSITSPFSADRRASTSIRRPFSSTSGTTTTRTVPFHRQTITLNETNGEGEGSGPTRAFLLSALDLRRRRIEEFRNSGGIAGSIAEQWRRQRDALTSLQAGLRATHTADTENNAASEVGPITPPQRYTSSSPRLFLGEDSSDSDSDDDDPDNKFSAASMNEIRHTTPPPTFLTPNASPSTTTTSPSSSKQNDDDSSRNAYTLSCKFCANVLTERGMRARLVADARVNIWSTDEQPK